MGIHKRVTGKGRLKNFLLEQVCKLFGKECVNGAKVRLPSWLD